MRVIVRLDPNCLFDIGARTPEVRALVKQYVKAFMDFAGRNGGQMPGARQVDAEPPTFAWKDANWLVAYTVEIARSTTTTIITEVRLFASGGSS